MTIPYPSLVSAFEGVKHNRGCAGVDRVTIQYFDHRLKLNLRALEYELHRRIYLPLPLMQIFVAKKMVSRESSAFPLYGIGWFRKRFCCMSAQFWKKSSRIAATHTAKAGPCGRPFIRSRNFTIRAADGL